MGIVCAIPPVVVVVVVVVVCAAIPVVAVAVAIVVVVVISSSNRRIASTVPEQGVVYCTIVTFICVDCTTMTLTVGSTVLSLEMVVDGGLDDGATTTDTCCCG